DSIRRRLDIENLLDGIDKLLPENEVLQQACAMSALIWIDRAFSIKGAGTVVTGTWAAGSVNIGDRLKLVTASGEHDVTVRGLHSENSAVDKAEPVMRLALNLRGVDADDISRGDVMTEAGSTW